MRSAPETRSSGSGSSRGGGGQLGEIGGADVGLCRIGEIGPSEKPNEARPDPPPAVVSIGSISGRSGGNSVPSVNHEPRLVVSAGG